MNPVAIKFAATYAINMRAAVIFLLVSWLLSGCAAPKVAVQPERYDLGATAPVRGVPSPPGAPVWLAGVQAPSSLDGTHMLYRLAFSDPLQSRAYAQARWSMPVPELIEQRLRQRLSAHHAVLNPADGVQGRGLVLRVDLEDFGQTFTATDRASVRVRLRATVSTWRGGAEQLLEQQTFESQQPCPTADAAGGVRALATASDAALEALEGWLDALPVR